MDKIIALGTAACNFAESLQALAPTIYEVYKINRNISGENCFSLPDYSTWDEYDQRDLGDYKNFLQNIEGQKILITSSGNTSGAVLRMLEHTGPEDTTVMYIYPDSTVISEEEAKRAKVTFGVLQEFAKSGAIKELMCVSNKLADLYCPNLTISRYLEGINDYIASVLHWNNIFQNTRPLISGSSWSRFNRISTIGISEVDLEKDEILPAESMLYSFSEDMREKHYFYAIPESILDTEAGLHRKLKEFTSSRQTSEISTTFSVFATKQDRPFCIIVEKARHIQKTA